jgi:uncharacterized protein YrrD
MEDLGKPIAYPALETGADVYSCDGEKLGRVKEVIADTNLDIFDGLIVDSGLLPGEGQYVVGDQVEEIFERGVLLKLDAEAARRLPPPNRNSSDA